MEKTRPRKLLIANQFITEELQNKVLVNKSCFTVTGVVFHLQLMPKVDLVPAHQSILGKGYV
jgi:hypothetical protein